MHYDVQCSFVLTLVLTLVTTISSTENDATLNRPHASRDDMVFRDILEKITSSQDYNGNVWPTFGKGPTNVTVNIYLNSFGSLNAANMKASAPDSGSSISDYTLDIFLRQMWHDERLKFDLPPGVSSLSFSRKEVLDKIWKPDLYFMNVKSSQIHTVTVPNVLVRMFPSGQILYSIRLTVTLSCHMVLYDFPFDKQKCYVNMSSYAYPSNVLNFHWLERLPIDRDPSMSMSQFDLEGIKVSHSMWHSMETGNYSTLTVTFKLRRQNGFHLIQTYLPTILIVLISWVSFWLDQNAIPARVTLGVTTILTITTLAAGVRTQLPPVSYIKAIDVWIGICMVFVFGALLEFTFVNFLTRKKIDPTQRKDGIRMKTLFQDKEEEMMKTMQDNPNTESSTLPQLPIESKTHKERAKQMDRICRLAFPLAFIVTNIFYWPYYLLDND